MASIVSNFLGLKDSQNINTTPEKVGQVGDMLAKIREEISARKKVEEERRANRPVAVKKIPEGNPVDLAATAISEERIFIPENLEIQPEDPKLRLGQVMTSEDTRVSFDFLQNFFSDVSEFLRLKEKYDEVKSRTPEGRTQVEQEKAEIEKGDIDEVLTEEAINKLLERGGGEKSKEILTKISAMFTKDYRKSIEEDKREVEDRISELETGHSEELAELVLKMEKYQQLAGPKVIENISGLMEIFHATRSSTTGLAERLRLSHEKSMHLVDETAGNNFPQDTLLFLSNLGQEKAGKILLDILISRFRKI